MGHLQVNSSWYFIPITPMHQYHSDYSDSVSTLYDHYIDSGRYV